MGELLASVHPWPVFYILALWHLKGEEFHQDKLVDGVVTRGTGCISLLRITPCSKLVGNVLSMVPPGEKVFHVGSDHQSLKFRTLAE